MSTAAAIKVYSGSAPTNSQKTTGIVYKQG
jgi:hypothetical protein